MILRAVKIAATATLAGILLAALAAPLAADIIHLKNGGKLEGKIIEETEDSIRVLLASGGKSVIPRSLIDRIEKKAFEVPLDKPDPPDVELVPPEDDGLGPVYLDSYLGYRLQPPASWVRAATASASALVTFFLKGSGAYRPKIDLIRLQFHSPREALATTWISSLEKGFPGFDLLSRREEPLADLPSIRLEGRFVSDGVHLRLVAYLLGETEDPKYALQVVAPEREWNDIAEPVARSLRTFRILPPPKLSPEEREAFEELYRLGHDKARLGRHREAAEAFRQALDVYPGSVEAWRNLAIIFMKTSDTNAALNAYEEVCRLLPEDAAGQYNRGTLLLRLQRPRDAVDALAKAIALDPRHADAHANLGVAHLSCGNAKGAVEALERAARLEPTVASYRYNLALAYRRLGRTDDAIRALEETLRLNPGHDGARKVLDELQGRK